MFEWPWTKAEKRRAAERAERYAAEDAARDAVECEVAETPFRVIQNPDGTWRAERCYAGSTYYFSIGFIYRVKWTGIYRADSLRTRALAQAAIRRYIKASEFRLDAAGDVVKP